MVLPPANGVQEQLPAPEASVTAHPPPEFAVTITVPVGVPAAGARGATVTDTVVGVPRT